MTAWIVYHTSESLQDDLFWQNKNSAGGCSQGAQDIGTWIISLNAFMVYEHYDGGRSSSSQWAFCCSCCKELRSPAIHSEHKSHHWKEDVITKCTGAFWIRGYSNAGKFATLKPSIIFQSWFTDNAGVLQGRRANDLCGGRNNLI